MSKKSSKQQCPRCGEREHVEAHHVEIDGRTAWHRTTCLECGCEYTEVYAFLYVEEEE